jgi:hypothetical protein
MVGDNPHAWLIGSGDRSFRMPNKTSSLQGFGIKSDGVTMEFVRHTADDLDFGNDQTLMSFGLSTGAVSFPHSKLATIGSLSHGIRFQDKLESYQGFGLLNNSSTLRLVAHPTDDLNSNNDIDVFTVTRATRILTVHQDLAVDGLVDGRDVDADGTAQDAHIADSSIHFPQYAGYYTESFSTVNTVNVNHALGKEPVVSILDGNGEEIGGRIVHTDVNNLVLNFLAVQTGSVNCVIHST